MTDSLEYVPADAFTRQFSNIYKDENMSKIEVGDHVSIDFKVVGFIDGVAEIVTEHGKHWFCRVEHLIKRIEADLCEPYKGPSVRGGSA